MNTQKDLFSKVKFQLIQIFAVSLFYFAFMLLLQPLKMTEYLHTTKFGYEFHVTITTSILLVTLLLSRGLFLLLRKKISLFTYSLWCIFEIIIASFFFALYIWLLHHRAEPYFDILGYNMLILTFELLLPYTAIHSLFIIFTENKKQNTPAPKMIKFKDSYGVLKLTVESSSLIYIKSDENYVDIFYKKGEDTVKYTLRSSLKKVEEECKSSNFYRCHRSFIVNTNYIKVLAKESDGSLYTELTLPLGTKLPISKRYYDGLVNLIG